MLNRNTTPIGTNRYNIYIMLLSIPVPQYNPECPLNLSAEQIIRHTANPDKLHMKGIAMRIMNGLTIQNAVMIYTNYVYNQSCDIKVYQDYLRRIAKVPVYCLYDEVKGKIIAYAANTIENDRYSEQPFITLCNE